MSIDYAPARRDEPDVQPGVQAAMGCVTGAVVACVVAVVIGQFRYLILGMWIAIPIGALVLTWMCMVMEMRLRWSHYTAGASLGWHAVGPFFVLAYLVLRAVI